MVRECDSRTHAFSCEAYAAYLPLNSHSRLRNLNASFMGRAFCRENQWGTMRSIQIGFAAGLSIALPLFGGVFGLPSSGIAAIVAAVAVLLLLPSIVATRQFGVILSPPLLAGAVFTCFVLLSAYESQWEFLVSPDLWRQNAIRYFDAKLFVFALSFGTGALASILVLAAPDKAATIEGVCLGVTVVSFMALFRLAFVYGHQLWATDIALARVFFVADKGLSTVSYGILMMMGAICSLRFRWGWVASAILLSWVVIIARRADTIIIVLAAVSFFGFLWVKGSGLSPLVRLFSFVTLATLIVAFGINGFSSAYFSNVLRGAEHRIDLLAASADEAFFDRETEYVAKSEGAVSKSKPENLKDSEQDVSTSEGLGYLSTGVLGKFKYPHNIIVEINKEVGVGGLLAFVAILLLPLLIAVPRFRSLQADAILALLLMGAMFGISLKAGDISNAGKILFFATLAYTAATSFTESKRSNSADAIAKPILG